MKITGARQKRFLDNPPADLIGVLLFGPDRGLAKTRAQALAKALVPDADDTFGAPDDAFGLIAADTNGTQQGAKELADRLLLKLSTYYSQEKAKAAP